VATDVWYLKTKHTTKEWVDPKQFFWWKKYTEIKTIGSNQRDTQTHTTRTLTLIQKGRKRGELK